MPREGDISTCVLSRDRASREEHKSLFPHPHQEKRIPRNALSHCFPFSFILYLGWGGVDLGFFRAFHLQFSMPTKGVRFSCPGSQARPLSPFRDSPFQVQHPGMGTVQRFSYKLLHLTPGWGCSCPSPGYSWEKKVTETALRGKFCCWVRRFPEAGARLRRDPKFLQQQPGISQTSHSLGME